MSLVDDRHPGIFRSADSQPVSREIIVDMKPVIVGHIVFRREVDPLFGPFGIIRAVMNADSMAKVKNAAAVSLRHVVTDQIFIGPLEKFWVGLQRRFVEERVTVPIVSLLG